MLPAFDAARALDLIERHGVTDTLRRADDARRAERGAAGSASRRREPARRSATAARPSRPRLSAARTPRSPTPSCSHIYGATETAPIATTFRGEEQCLDSPRARSCGQPAVGVEIADPRHRRRRGADRRGRRGRDPRRQRHGRLLEQARADRGRARRRLVPLGRPRLPGRRGLPLPRRPGQGHDRDAAARTSTARRSKTCSTGIRPCSKRPCSACPTPRGARPSTPSSCPRTDVSERELLEHCRAAIAGYKVPKQIELRTDPLPKSGAGKVLKRELREPYWQGPRVAGRRLVTTPNAPTRDDEDIAAIYDELTDGLRLACGSPSSSTQRPSAIPDMLPTRADDRRTSASTRRRTSAGLEIDQGEFVGRGARAIRARPPPDARDVAAEGRGPRAHRRASDDRHASISARSASSATGPSASSPSRTTRSSTRRTTSRRPRSRWPSTSCCSTTRSTSACCAARRRPTRSTPVGASSASGINLTHLYYGKISLVEFMIERELGAVSKMYRGHALGRPRRRLTSRSGGRSRGSPPSTRSPSAARASGCS